MKYHLNVLKTRNTSIYCFNCTYLYGCVPVAGVFISYPYIMIDKGAIDLVFLIQERILHFRNRKVKDLIVDLLSSELSIILYASVRVCVDK